MVNFIYVYDMSMVVDLMVNKYVSIFIFIWIVFIFIYIFNLIIKMSVKEIYVFNDDYYIRIVGYYNSYFNIYGYVFIYVIYYYSYYHY